MSLSKMNEALNRANGPKKGNEMAPEVKLALKVGGSVVGGIVALILFFGSYAIVPPGHRGIVIHAGQVQDQVLGEGLTFKMPLYTTVKSFPVRVEESTIETQAASKDMQTVGTKISLNWHVEPTKVNDVFRRLGEPEVIQANVITHAVSEVLKAETAKMSAEEILSKRVELKTAIDNALIERLKVFDISVDAVNLSDFAFTPEFNRAVEEKQIAEQTAKKAEYEAQKATVDAKAAVNKAKGEAEAALTRAEAEAKANALKQKTLTDELIRYEMVTRWNGEMPQVVMGNGGTGMLNLGDLTKKSSKKGE